MLENKKLSRFCESLRCRGGGIRTHDLVDPNDARYQLRYAPIWAKVTLPT